MGTGIEKTSGRLDFTITNIQCMLSPIKQLLSTFIVTTTETGLTTILIDHSLEQAFATTDY